MKKNDTRTRLKHDQEVLSPFSSFLHSTSSKKGKRKRGFNRGGKGGHTEFDISYSRGRTKGRKRGGGTEGDSSHSQSARREKKQSAKGYT